MRTCTSCGKGIADNTKFCPFCGAPCEQTEQTEQDVYSASQENTGDGVYYEPAKTGAASSGSTKGMSIAGLVLGVVAIVFVFIPGVSFLGWIMGVVGIVLSAIAISQAKKAGEKNGMAVAGLVLSIVSIAIGIIVVMVACIAGCAIAGTAGLFY